MPCIPLVTLLMSMAIVYVRIYVRPSVRTVRLRPTARLHMREILLGQGCFKFSNVIGQNEGDYFQLCICMETCVQCGMEAVYIYAWRLVFRKELKLCIYMHGDLCSLRN